DPGLHRVRQARQDPLHPLGGLLGGGALRPLSLAGTNSIGTSFLWTNFLWTNLLWSSLLWMNVIRSRLGGQLPGAGRGCGLFIFLPGGQNPRQPLPPRYA